jgi:hypothetical protein
MFPTLSRFTTALAMVVLASGLLTGARGASAQSIDTAALYFNGLDTLYRSPVAAVVSGSPVTLRFRTAHDGATSVTVFVELVDPTSQTTPGQVPMTLDVVHSNGQYDFWQAVVTPASTGIWAYWFLIKDGSSQAWYADSPGKALGAAGAPATSPPFGTIPVYELVAYQSDFTVPSWLKPAELLRR